jgi:hypothetical protein
MNILLEITCIFQYDDNIMVGTPGVATEAPVDLNSILNAPSLLSNERLAVEPGKPDKKAKVVKTVEEKKPVVQGTTFDRSKFVVEETTGINFKEHHKKVHTVEESNVVFSPELKGQFERFLTTHVEDLLKITNPQILDNGQHEDEKILLKAITTNNKLDQSQMSNFLKTDEGWSITQKLLEHQTALKLVAYGVEASINPQGKRVIRIDDHTISLHADQGVMNHLIKERLGHYLNERAFNVAGRPHGDWRDKVSKGGFIASNAGASVLASGVGAALGTIVGAPTFGALAGIAVPGAVEGVVHLFRDGVQIDINQSAGCI